VLTNRQIARAVAAQMNLPPEKVEAILRRFHAEVMAAAARGERLRLHGFATIQTLPGVPRRVRDPRTGKARDLPAKRGLRFRLSPMFRARAATVLPKPSAMAKHTRQAQPEGRKPWWKVW
jgi:nucleoid DNA-binding protein